MIRALSGLDHRRRRRGGGRAALRPQRQHRAGGRDDDVRDPVRGGAGARGPDLEKPAPSRNTIPAQAREPMLRIGCGPGCPTVANRQLLDGLLLDGLRIPLAPINMYLPFSGFPIRFEDPIPSSRPPDPSPILGKDHADPHRRRRHPPVLRRHRQRNPRRVRARVRGDSRSWEPQVRCFSRPLPVHHLQRPRIPTLRHPRRSGRVLAGPRARRRARGARRAEH